MRRSNLGILLLPLLTVLLSAPETRAQTAPPFQLQVAHSPNGMVAAAQPLATWAGVRMLEAGGNAADAAVAAAFAIAVVEPTMNSIGGRTQILIRLPDGEVRGIDATTQAPMTYDPETAPQAGYGYAVIGVPGAVAGLVRLQSEFGTLPLETVMGPAISFAGEGFAVLPAEAQRQAAGAEQVREFEGTRRYYLNPDGEPHQAGERLTQEDLARTLTAISKTDGETFYRGEIARAMAVDLQAKGSPVTLESLGDYRAEDAHIVRGSCRGYELAGMNVPAAGAVAIEALQILENFDLSTMDPAERAAHVGRALGLAFRDWQLQGPREVARQITSKEFAAYRAGEMELGGPMEMMMGPQAQNHMEGSHTTHLSTADSQGMMVALTQTLGPNMGSKVATPGLGFLYASTLGGYLGEMQPGERARSFICPLMVLEDGEPVMVLGAAGGGMIPVAVVNTIVHFVDGGLPFPDAVAAPRIAPSGDGFNMETHPGAGWTEGAVEVVRGMGLEIRPIPREGAFGRLHAIRYDSETGLWTGVADPDWEGTALGPRKGAGS